ncbi:CNNM domain-containing protein [Neorhodopirellula lusitana]|uniref:CNNM domain-containing protein n=1 Tax=Neorhodopirellula lusitana TaxID=445327 RepID=UPI00384C19E2
MIAAILLFLIGLTLSAFFSGSETGLYRVSRTRLILDGLSGSIAGRGLVWLINHPAIFVATTLVGNNLANYLTSFAIVMFVVHAFGSGASIELGLTVLMTPIVFVFGELLPKHLFFQAPYRLLTATRWVLLFATALFSPVSSLLAVLGNALQALTGETPFRLRLTMARGDLDQVLRDGHEAGILATSQRRLAKNIFEIGNQRAVQFGMRPDRLAVVNSPVDLPTARRLARRCNHPIILVRRRGRIAGFFRFADLIGKETSPEPMPIVRGNLQDRHLNVLLRLYDANSDVAVLYDASGNLVSVVTRRQLLQSLM